MVVTPRMMRLAVVVRGLEERGDPPVIKNIQVAVREAGEHLVGSSSESSLRARLNNLVKNGILSEEWHGQKKKYSFTPLGGMLEEQVLSEEE